MNAGHIATVAVVLAVAGVAAASLVDSGPCRTSGAAARSALAAAATTAGRPTRRRRSARWASG